LIPAQQAMVWPEAEIFLCLWHVKKAWAKNAIKKISSAGERIIVLQMLGDIMYGKGCNVDGDPIDLALDQLDKISNTRPLASALMRYMNEVWQAKTPMWCVGGYHLQDKLLTQLLNPTTAT
jgi:hypothetical protein